MTGVNETIFKQKYLNVSSGILAQTLSVITYQPKSVCFCAMRHTVGRGNVGGRGDMTLP